MATRSTNGRFEKKEKPPVAKNEEEPKADVQAAPVEAAAPAYVNTDPTRNANGSPKKMVIAREGGMGEREITVDEWERKFAHADAGTWRIVRTEVVASHHSDDAV